MRRVRLALSALAGVTAVVTLGTSVGASSAPTLASCRTSLASHEYAKGTLTVATDRPAYTPWFANNTPTNGKGYESAVVYALAKVLGVPAAKVNWVVEPFDSSYVPGVKKFDFDINEVSYTSARAQAVTFSSSYYNVTQSIVALKTNPIVTKHSPSQLKTYLYGDQVGTTGLTYINDHIKPTRTPRVYSTLDQAVAALQSHQIDAIVVDTPDGQYMASAQIQNAKHKSIATQVGQFPSTGEHFGLLFQKGNPLAACVDAGIAALRSNGTLRSLQKKYLGIYNQVPLIQP